MDQGYKFKTYTDDELLDIIIKYNNEKSFPTQRAFRRSNGLPSYATYCNRFGSFKNAIKLAGIEIPKNRKRFFERDYVSDEILLESLRVEFYKKIKNIKFPIENISGFKSFYLTLDEIDEIKEMASSSSYLNRFGSVINMYSMIDIDVEKLNSELFKKDMSIKYNELYALLGRIPTSRDLTKFSNGSDYYYCTGSYLYHFKTFDNIYKRCGIDENVSRNMTDEHLLNILSDFFQENCIVPNTFIINSSNNMPSVSIYKNRFGSLVNAYKKAGIPESQINKTAYYTNNGVECLSYYEYIICSELEKECIYYEKEIPYKDCIENFDKLYRFDLKLKNKCFVEIFGITGREDYNNKTQNKINICKDNDIHMIALFPEDVMLLVKNEKNIYELLNLKGENYEN